MLVFNVPPTVKVIWRRGHGLKSHPTDSDWRSRESNLRPLVYKLKMLSVAYICLHYFISLTNVGVEGNSVDPDQTAPTGAV